MRYIVAITLVGIAWLIVGGVTVATEYSPVLNKKVDDFKLRSSLGREWSLADFSDKELVVVTFLGTECPLAKIYGGRLAELDKKYSKQGVAFLGVNANTQDSITELTAYANRHEITFPMLKDVGNKLADAMGAQRTPEVFVLDRDRVIRYHGRIDDQYAVGVSRNSADRQDLVEAIDELLAGKNVSVPETKVNGCYIGRAKTAKATGEITYSNQIVRILNQRCVECHRDGEIAPFTLTSYEDILGWEDTIVEVIEDQRMPPWFANPEHGKFHNDARLSPDEKELIFKWVANGMPQGDPADMPPAPTFSKGWRIREPDQIIHMRDEPFTVPSQGVISYKRYEVDPGWTEDKYICAAEARPGNNAVVHHILVFVLQPGEGRKDLGQVLVGYAPGSTPVELAEGVALRVPAGSKLQFEMHYTPNGHEQTDRSYIGVCFTEKENVKQLIRGRVAIEREFEIPANTANYQVKSHYEFARDELLLSMTPHMHLRGKAFRYEAAYPNGEREIVLDVPAYDFNWQLKYILAEPKLMPKGTTMFCTAAYNNSESNLANPNPNQSVRWGDQSDEEMMIGFFDTLPAESEVTQGVASKNVKIDPSGSWTWKQRLGRDEIDQSLTLQLQGDRLTGIFVANGETTEITDAIMNGETLTFSVESPKLKGMLISFVGKAEADAIKGETKITIEAYGRSFSVPWIARRAESKSK